MAESTYDLTAPDGTKVTVKGATRRDTLLDRGYTEGHGAKTTSSKSSSDSGSSKE